MIRNASTIRAVGAAGKFAGLLIPELAKRGVTDRGLVKHKNQFDDARGLKGCALTLRAIWGREPRTLRAYFEELAAESQEVEMSRVEPSSLARRGASWSM
jgi:hypothetical protein